jgi:Polyketide cyclase / dehydrase and lipid transport
MTETAGESGEPVSVSRRIPAGAAAVFAVIADPTRHPDIDGSGMLLRAVWRPPITRVGDTFTMLMRNDEMGYYEITNHVVEYVSGERIAWEPSLTNASRAEDQDDIGTRNQHRWSYELTPDDSDDSGDSYGTGGTLVTETYDCTRAPDWLRGAVKDGQRWVAAMTETLEKLERECGRSS